MSSNFLFLDAAYAVALASPNDQCHEQAVRLASELKLRRLRMLTTQAVVLEVGNALSKPRFRRAAVQLLTSLLTDPRIEIVPLTSGLVEQAFHLFRERPDKGWGLTDCVSFIVMKERGILEALTTDEHFEQAGFTALLRH